MKRAERRKSGAPVTPNRRNLILYGTLAVLAIGIIVAVALASRVPETASTAPTFAAIKVGQQAPDFSAATTAGLFQLDKAKGKPVLLEVFATWCPHCQREVATLNNLRTAYKDRVAFVAVSGSEFGMLEGTPETQADVVAFAEKFKAQYPIAYDGQLDVAKKYLQGGFPTIVIIGRSGKIAAIHDGEIPPNVLREQLDAALKS